MNITPIYNDEGEIVGSHTSYEIKNDCSNDTNHHMEYSNCAGVIGGKCQDCDYHTN